MAVIIKDFRLARRPIHAKKVDFGLGSTGPAASRNDLGTNFSLHALGEHLTS
jgi:hypothetical protein